MHTHKLEKSYISNANKRFDQVMHNQIINLTFNK